MNLKSTDFAIINSKEPTAKIVNMYITTNTSWNVMIIAITNNTGQTITLTGGVPLNGPQPGGASSFVVDFDGLLSPEEVEAIDITEDPEIIGSPKWAYKLFPPDDDMPSTWAMAPINDLTLGIGEVARFTISNIVKQSQNPGFFEIRYYNIKNINDRSFAYTYNISALNIPGGSPLPLDYGFFQFPPFAGSGIFLQEYKKHNFDINTTVNIYITYNNNFPIENEFTLYLTNKNPSPLEQDSTPIGTAAVYISFIFATEDDTAITSQALGDNISIGIDPSKSKWSSIAHTSDTSSWKFIPNDNLIMEANESIKFPVGNLITELNTPPKTLSTVFIQINNFPGFNDAVFSIQMLKQIATPGIQQFIVLPEHIEIGDNVTLTWVTYFASRVVLEFNLRDGKFCTLDSAQGQINLSEANYQPAILPDAEFTNYKLSIYGSGTDPVAQESQPITVNQKQALICSFTASSQLVDITSAQNTTTLQWDVLYAQSIEIEGFGKQTGNSLVVTINQSTVYTITVTSFGDQFPPSSQNIKIYAYKSFAPVIVGPIGDGTVFQSLPLSVVNNTLNKIYVANAASRLTFQINRILKTIDPNTFQGNVFALSNDQQKLFLSQTSPTPPTMVFMYDTANPSMVSSQPLNPPPPYCMTVNNSVNKLYLAQQHRCTAISVFSVNESANTLSYIQDVTVGESPEAFAFDNANPPNLYVANYDSQVKPNINSYITVINSETLAFVKNITLDATEPGAFAINGSDLYVACQGENNVAWINLDTGVVTNIQAGNRPFSMSFNQNKTLLYVTNFGTNTVSVIDTTSHAVVKTLFVGNGPAAVKITGSGKLMFVSNYCDKTLSVVDISGSTQIVIGTINLGTTNGNPIDISTFGSDNFYTDVFIAKEYFKDRSNSCTTSPVTDTNLNMSILSIQELS